MLPRPWPGDEDQRNPGRSRITFGGNQVHITASIGIALRTADTATPETLIVHAGVALYRAKEDGRNCSRFHSADLDQRRPRAASTIADDLRTAVKNGELRLHYQPQVELSSGRIVGIEALLRWQHPQARPACCRRRSSVSPRRTGHIVALGEWAFDEACLPDAGVDRPRHRAGVHRRERVGEPVQGRRPLRSSIVSTCPRRKSRGVGGGRADRIRDDGSDGEHHNDGLEQTTAARPADRDR